MLVLGIHAGHDSSCAVVKDGRIVADVQEERFNRVKHSKDVPVKALAYCLKAADVKSINDFDRVAIAGVASGAPLRALLRLPMPKTLRHTAKQFLEDAGILGRARIKPPLYYADYGVRDSETKVVNVEHHLAHAASAHFTRRSAEKALIFTIDGAGDSVSTAVWEGEGNKIRPLVKVPREYSIGHPYSVVTEGLHWWHGDGEGKTMGLAPYGNPDKCAGVLDYLFPVIKGTEFIKDNGLKGYGVWEESGTHQFHLDESAGVEKLIERYGREHIAAEAQRRLEEIVMGYVYAWIEKTGLHRTAYAGGVFLNVKLNQHLWNGRLGRIEEQHVFPNCADSGLAVGAALYAYYQSHAFDGMMLDNLYFGPAYSDDHIEYLLKERNLEYEIVAEPWTVAAEMLAQDKIVAWFQGRMESGPRALGGRSILMSPCKPENKDIINARVKFREAFRPFCPSILHEYASEYMLDTRDEFFMITSFDVNPKYRDKMPAVVHADGTLRPQMVTKAMSPMFWNLIDQFGKRTGVYCLLNTSMNIRGEPMINTPQEAIRCLFDTGLDALVMGKFVLRKPKSFQR